MLQPMSAINKECIKHKEVTFFSHCRLDSRRGNDNHTCRQKFGNSSRSAIHCKWMLSRMCAEVYWAVTHIGSGFKSKLSYQWICHIPLTASWIQCFPLRHPKIILQSRLHVYRCCTLYSFTRVDQAQQSVISKEVSEVRLSSWLCTCK